jgi:hypothetical protein
MSMRKSLATKNGAAGTCPWGEANPQRGVNYSEIAAAFVLEFPVGTEILIEDFDEWASKSGFLDVPTGARKNSGAWKAHIDNRHKLKTGINAAGPHPRMDTPFVLDIVTEGKVWVVRSPHEAMKRRDKKLSRLATLVNTNRRQLAYLMQSADWHALPAYERVFAESLYEDINQLWKEVQDKVTFYGEKYSKLESRLRKSVAAGEITPLNGGIKGIIAPKTNDEDGD